MALIKVEARRFGRKGMRTPRASQRNLGVGFWPNSSRGRSFVAQKEGPSQRKVVGHESKLEGKGAGCGAREPDGEPEG